MGAVTGTYPLGLALKREGLKALASHHVALMSRPDTPQMPSNLGPPLVSDCLLMAAMMSVVSQVLFYGTLSLHSGLLPPNNML